MHFASNNWQVFFYKRVKNTYLFSNTINVIGNKQLRIIFFHGLGLVLVYIKAAVVAAFCFLLLRQKLFC
jgi:hypothetical protein